MGEGERGSEREMVRGGNVGGEEGRRRESKKRDMREVWEKR